MKVDRLFVERSCPHCGMIRAVLNMDAVIDDGFRGADGQLFHVFSSQSNQASIELLGKFGVEGKFMPVLLTHTGEVMEKPTEIAAYLKKQGMARN